MAAVVLRAKAPPPFAVDLAALKPAALAGRPAGEIERIALGRLVVGDLFAVTAGDAAELVIAGGSLLFTGIGAFLQTGSLLVEGDAGPFAAAEMRGGRIEIRGDAGDCLAAARADGRRGMAGGSVVVRGRAGEGAGAFLRRGVVVVEGDAGAGAGMGMIAGTLAICGAAGPHAGALMRRGTLLLGTAPPAPPAGFIPGRLAADGVFPALLSRALRPLSAPAAACAGAVRQRWLGDLAALGKGEILLAGAMPG
jgi:formylmethanofuran dehydrogenase subunit C